MLESIDQFGVNFDLVSVVRTYRTRPRVVILTRRFRSIRARSLLILVGDFYGRRAAVLGAFQQLKKGLTIDEYRSRSEQVVKWDLRGREDGGEGEGEGEEEDRPSLIETESSAVTGVG